jgi:hypothetical protein
MPYAVTTRRTSPKYRATAPLAADSAVCTLSGPGAHRRIGWHANEEALSLLSISSLAAMIQLGSIHLDLREEVGELLVERGVVAAPCLNADAQQLRHLLHLVITSGRCLARLVRRCHIRPAHRRRRHQPLGASTCAGKKAPLALAHVHGSVRGACSFLEGSRVAAGFCNSAAPERPSFVQALSAA